MTPDPTGTPRTDADDARPQDDGGQAAQAAGAAVPDAEGGREQPAGEPVPEPAGEAAPEGGAQPEAEAPTAEEHARALAERDEYLDALRRLKAEFENYRKRSERERQAFAQAAARDLVEELLPVLDNLERAIDALAGQDPELAAGVAMVREQLKGLLASRGVTEIEAHEQQFDPAVHEAVTTSPSADHEEGRVLAVVQKGYRLHDTVLRPARVVVSAGSP